MPNIVVEEEMIVIEAIGKRKAITSKEYGIIEFMKMDGYQGDCAKVPYSIARGILRDEQLTLNSINNHNLYGGKNLLPPEHMRKGKTPNFIKAVKTGEKRPKLPELKNNNIKVIVVPNEFAGPPAEETIEAPEMGVDLPEEEPSIPEAGTELKQPKGRKAKNKETKRMF